jgi:hypothetical protein
MKITLYRAFYIACCAAFVSLLSGCAGSFYSLAVDEPGQLKYAKPLNGGIAVQTYLFGCTNFSHKIYVDDSEQLWLYCDGYYQEAYSQFVSAGPAATPIKHDGRSSSGRDKINALRSRMTEIKLDKCKNFLWCGSYRKSGYDEMYVSVDTAAGDTYFEYVSYRPILEKMAAYYPFLEGRAAAPETLALVNQSFLDKFIDEGRATQRIMSSPDKSSLERSKSFALRLGISSRKSISGAYSRRYYELDYADSFKRAKNKSDWQVFVKAYRNYDPSGLVRQAELKLIAIYRGEKTATGFSQAFKLSRDKADFNSLQAAAKNSADLTLLANAVFDIATNKGQFLNVSFDFNNVKLNTREQTNAGVFSNYEFFGVQAISGSGSIRPAANSPLAHSKGKYRVVLLAELSIQRSKQVRSSVVGNQDTSSNIAESKEIEVILAPPYKERFSVDFGNNNLIYFDRGSRGGFTAIWPDVDPKITISVKSIESIDSQQ